MEKAEAVAETKELAKRDFPACYKAMAERFNIEPGRMLRVLKGTVIKPTKEGREATDEEVAAFIMVANEYGLNPFTREIHAFSDPRKGVVPIVGVDGWVKLVNKNLLYDGCEFQEIFGADGKLTATTCLMHVKGRSKPVNITERLSECRRDTTPWSTMPHRMLRHKAFMQAARMAFGLPLMDEDEARDSLKDVEGAVVHTGTSTANGTPKESMSKTDALTNRLTGKMTLPALPEPSIIPGLPVAGVPTKQAVVQSNRPSDVPLQTPATGVVPPQPTAAKRGRPAKKQEPVNLMPTPKAEEAEYPTTDANNETGNLFGEETPPESAKVEAPAPAQEEIEQGQANEPEPETAPANDLEDAAAEDKALRKKVWTAIDKKAKENKVKELTAKDLADFFNTVIKPAFSIEQQKEVMQEASLAFDEDVTKIGIIALRRLINICKASFSEEN